jgi:hypothetical protein
VKIRSGHANLRISLVRSNSGSRPDPLSDTGVEADRWIKQNPNLTGA